MMIELSKKYNIEIIAGVDSHFIYEADAWKRDYLQKSSGIFLEDEQGWYMDYPDGKTLFNRFKRQGTLQDDEILIEVVTDSVCMSTYKECKLGAEHERVNDDIDINQIRNYKKCLLTKKH